MFKVIVLEKSLPPPHPSWTWQEFLHQIFPPYWLWNLEISKAFEHSGSLIRCDKPFLTASPLPCRSYVGWRTVMETQNITWKPWNWTKLLTLQPNDSGVSDFCSGTGWGMKPLLSCPHRTPLSLVPEQQWAPMVLKKELLAAAHPGHSSLLIKVSPFLISSIPGHFGSYVWLTQKLLWCFSTLVKFCFVWEHS